MKITIAPVEIGIIVKALEKAYGSDSLEREILGDQLINSVERYFSLCGHAEMFDTWLQEFDIERPPFFE